MTLTGKTYKNLRQTLEYTDSRIENQHSDKVHLTMATSSKGKNGSKSFFNRNSSEIETQIQKNSDRKSILNLIDDTVQWKRMLGFTIQQILIY